MKNIRIFCLTIFILLVVKFSVYLNRRVFVMLFLLIAHFVSYRDDICLFKCDTDRDFHFLLFPSMLLSGDS